VVAFYFAREDGREEGMTFAEIGQRVGISRQARPPDAWEGPGTSAAAIGNHKGVSVRASESKRTPGKLRHPSAIYVTDTEAKESAPTEPTVGALLF